MKILLAFFMALLSLSQTKCTKDKTSVQSTAGSSCFKGRLEIKGICGNYTIKLLEGNIDQAKIEASWKDENTNKTYTNVFALASPCNFPADLAEGSEFYFQLDDAPQNCMVCQAYYPKPAKALSIKVLEKACQ